MYTHKEAVIQRCSLKRCPEEACNFIKKETGPIHTCKSNNLKDERNNEITISNLI